MITGLVRTDIKLYNKKITVETDKCSLLIIHEQPEGVIHETQDDATRHQITSMMVFQEKLSMLLRATLKSVGVTLPLPVGKYSIEVNLKSSRKISELAASTIRQVTPASPLLNVLKAVIDALNEQIISNDNQIQSAEIVYNSGPFSKLDHLEIRLFDVSQSPAALITQVATDVYVIPKEPPMILDAENTPIVWFSNDHKALAAKLRSIINLPQYKLYHIDMQFSGAVKGNDIDNMAKIYLPVLNKLGIADDLVHRLTLTKHSNKNSQGTVSIQILPLSLHHATHLTNP